MRYDYKYIVDLGDGKVREFDGREESLPGPSEVFIGRLVNPDCNRRGCYGQGHVGVVVASKELKVDDPFFCKCVIKSWGEAHENYISKVNQRLQVFKVLKADDSPFPKVKFMPVIRERIRRRCFWSGLFLSKDKVRLEYWSSVVIRRSKYGRVEVQAVPQPIPLKYLKEIVVQWSVKLQGTGLGLKTFYLDNRELFPLHPASRTIVEALIFGQGISVPETLTA